MRGHRSNPGAQAKVYLAQAYPSFAISPHCRVRDFTFLPEDLEKLKQLQLMMEDLCREVGIAPVAPPACAGAGGPPAKRSRGDDSEFPVD